MQSRRPIISILIVFPIVAAIVVTCWPTKKGYSDADITFLASDAHVVVGDVPLTVPIIALPGLLNQTQSFSLHTQTDREAATERLAAFRKSTGSPETAPTIDTLEISLRTYGWNDFDISIIRVCSRLTRQWSRSVCDDPWSPFQQAMPRGNNHFILADDRKLKVFNNHWTVGKERVADHLDEMRLNSEEASTVCDAETPSNRKFCTAAIRIKEHLIAVWTVWDGPGEPYSRQAEREGHAIRQFVLHGLGPIEDFARLLSVICKLKDPAAPPGPYHVGRKDACDRASPSRFEPDRRP